MRVARTSRLVLGAAVLVTAAATTLVARPVADGITYEFRMTATNVDGGRSKETMNMRGRGRISGTNARIDFESGGNMMPMSGKGGYMLMRGGSSGAMIMVNPEEKSYMEMRFEDMGRMMTAVSSMPGIRMDVTDVNTTTAKVGAGPAILGHATEHYRVTQTYKMNMSMMGRRSSTTSRTVTDHYLAPDLRNLVNPMLEFSRSLTSSLGGNSGGFAELMRQSDEAQKALFQGVPLRSVIRAETTDDRGRTQVSETVNEVTSITRGDIPASVFEIPSGYRQVQMPSAPEGAPTRNAADAPEGDGKTVGGEAKEAAAESARDAAARRLRGIRRP